LLARRLERSAQLPINRHKPRIPAPSVRRASTLTLGLRIGAARVEGCDMNSVSLSKIACLLVVFCVSMAIGTTAQMLTTLVNFSDANGADSFAPLIQGTDGNFYGTTADGGANQDSGTVFKMTPGGALTTLYSFCNQASCADGAAPQAGLAQGTDGNFYGTTAYGGTNCIRRHCGTVFKITPAGVLTTLHSFDGVDDGNHPSGGLVEASDNNFYGTTSGAGPNGAGTIFQITTGGTLTTIYSFCSQDSCADGQFPVAGLIQGSDGNLYGTTSGGGANGYGTVFRISLAGSLTTLYSFCAQANCTDGAIPVAGLVQGTDGNLYGSTQMGGSSTNCNGGCGTIFEITSGGSLTPLYSFCAQANCTDGAVPVAALVQGTDGNLYGSTQMGGSGTNCNGGCGTLFEITTAGALSSLYSFCAQANCPDGSSPVAGLIQASSGTFYGTTQLGGSGGGCNDGCGTVFSLSVGIVLSPLQFVPVVPCRLVDTRIVSGGTGPIAGGTFEFFNLPQTPQKAQNCPTLDLSSAAAYSLNVTVVPQVPLGYLTVWPAGRNRPNVSTLNSLDGRVKANAAIVPAGASQAISVFASNTTDVVIDIDGYFAPVSDATLAFYPLTPCRVADTRNASKPPGLGPPYLQGKTQRDFPVLNSPCFPQGLNPAAYSFNFTVVPHVPLGYLTVWPAGQPQPGVSTLNALTGTTTANAAIVPAGMNGDIDVFASNDTDVVIDVNGYFAAPGAGGLSLYPVAPCRVIDTRTVGNGQPFVGELTVDVVDSPCAPPSTAQAYTFNATVVPSGELGYLTLWPDCPTCQQPGVSTLNAIDGAITSNMAIVPNIDGSTDAFASNLTQLILDISSYFAP